MTDRVTYVVPRFLPSLGGIENHVAAIGSQLVRRGWSVDVATQIESQDSIARNEILPNGIRAIRFRSRLPIYGQGVSVALGRYAAAQAAAGELVHLHNYHALTTLYAGRSLVRASTTAPLVITPHYLGVGAGAAQAAMHAVYGRAFRAILGRADQVVAVCASEAARLSADFGVAADKIAVIANGVDAEVLRAAQPFESDRRRVLVAGRLMAYKGHLSVLRAVAELPADYELVVAGQGPLEADLVALAGELGISDRLRLLGRLSGPELARWYASASVVVSMSSRECFGLTLVEAIASGAPIVASDIGAHRDVATLCQYPADALVGLDSTPAHLATVIRSAAERGRHRPGRYPVPLWSAVSEQYGRLYRELSR